MENKSHPSYFGSICGTPDQGSEEMEDTLAPPYENEYEKKKWNSHGFDQSGMR